MGKISKALLMLNYLSTGNKYTIDDLASKLDISSRMVRYYKDELEKAGIYIESFKGPNGGYFMLDPVSSYNQFNKYDIQLLDRVNQELEKNKFEYTKKFKLLVSKIKDLTKVQDEKNKFISEINDKDKNEMVNLFKRYIKNKDSIKILYRDISGEWSERVINPLQMFKFDDNVYITAYCELRNDIRHFELNRIKINN